MIHDATHTPPPMYMATMAAMDRVSFGQHVRALMLFRDPMKLYPVVNVTITAYHADALPGERETMQ